MERITNDNIKVFEQLKIELSYSEEKATHNLLFCYTEISQLMIYAYSFIALKDKNKEQYQYFIKLWDSNYDKNRFNLGIFNIDRLAIKEREITLDEIEHNSIQQLYQKPLRTKEYEGIVLDGLFCQLNIPAQKRNLEWNIDGEMNHDLSNFVLILRKIAHKFDVFD